MQLWLREAVPGRQGSRSVLLSLTSWQDRRGRTSTQLMTRSKITLHSTPAPLSGLYKASATGKILVQMKEKDLNSSSKNPQNKSLISYDCVFWTTCNIGRVIWFILSLSDWSLATVWFADFFFFFLSFPDKFSGTNWSSKRVNPVILSASLGTGECCLDIDEEKQPLNLSRCFSDHMARWKYSNSCQHF